MSCINNSLKLLPSTDDVIAKCVHHNAHIAARADDVLTKCVHDDTDTAAGADAVLSGRALVAVFSRRQLQAVDTHSGYCELAVAATDSRRRPLSPDSVDVDIGQR